MQEVIIILANDEMHVLVNKSYHMALVREEVKLVIHTSDQDTSGVCARRREDWFVQALHPFCVSSVL